METILIVDDDPAIREIFTTYLEMGGFRALGAEGGKACIELMKSEKPDIILLDLMMEPIDGWETLLMIRKNPVSEDIPVIIITGKPPVPEDVWKYGGLIADFMLKPIDFDRVVEALPEIIEKERNLARETEMLRNEGEDLELLREYQFLLRLVRVAHRLESRLRGRSKIPSFSLPLPEERLYQLHKKLGFPDHFLEPGGGEIERPK